MENLPNYDNWKLDYPKRLDPAEPEKDDKMTQTVKYVKMEDLSVVGAELFEWFFEADSSRFELALITKEHALKVLEPMGQYVKNSEVDGKDKLGYENLLEAITKLENGVLIDVTDGMGEDFSYYHDENDENCDCDFCENILPFNKAA